MDSTNIVGPGWAQVAMASDYAHMVVMRALHKGTKQCTVCTGCPPGALNTLCAQCTPLPITKRAHGTRWQADCYTG